MIFQLSKYLIVIFFLMLIFLAIFPIKNVGLFTPKYIWICFVFCSAVFVFFSNPSISDDLYRHYASIDNMRNGTYTARSPLLLLNLYFGIVSLTPWNGLLPCINVIIIGLLVYRVVEKCVHSTTNMEALAYLSAMAGFGTFAVVSGIRCALVCTIFAYAYIFYYYGDRKKYYILSIGASLIHLVGVVLILLVFLNAQILESKNRQKTIVHIVICAFVFRILLTANIISYILYLVPGSYGALLRLKWNDYYKAGFSDQTRGIFGWALWTFLILSVVISWILYRKRILYDNVVLSMVSILIFATGSDIFAYRIPYAIGILQIPLFEEYSKSARGEKKIFFLWFCLAIFVVRIMFDTYRLISHFNFNEENYRLFFRSVFHM